MLPALALLLWTALAFAQDAVDPAPAGPTLPQVLAAPAPPYPPAALAAGAEATVELELAIAEDGTVLDARVVTPVGDGFDEAALLAAQGTTFTPARDATGAPVRAVIGYRVAFRVDAVPPPSIEGVVREAGVRDRLAGIELSAVGPDGAQAFALTGPDGAFTFVGLAPGAWTVAAQGPALQPLTEAVMVSADAVISLDLYLVRDSRQDALQGDETLVVEAERATAEITERRLTAEEVQYLPGTSGDVVRVVQNLPGVARAPLGTGNLIIRGTAPEDSAYFIDGSPIPLVFHFAGLTAVINGDTIDEVAFIPGNPSVRYGRVLGGLVDLRTDPTLPERSGGAVSIDLYQSTVFVEQRVGERTAVALSGRRSYIDAVLNPILSGGGMQVQAPRYYDAQLRLLHRSDRGATWDALFFLSDDQFRFLGTDEGEEESLASFSDQFQRARLRRLAPVGGGPWTSETTLGFGPERRDFSFGTGDSAAFERDLSLSVRQELSAPLAADRPLGARTGVDLLVGQDSFFFDEARFSDSEEGEALYLKPAAYAELSGRLGRLTVVPGLRYEGLFYDTGYGASALDPRATVRYTLTDSTVLKAAGGRYTSLPSLRQVDPESDGNPGLSLPWALQTSFGVQQQLGGRVSAEVVGFYNRLYDLVVGREDRLRFFTGPPPVGPFDTDPYANDGVGLVCGSELQVRYTGPTAVGLLALTLSHSERTDRPGEESELFAYDQPLVLNALWSQQLPKNWRLGGRVRLSSGNPYTPVTNRVYDQQSRQFVPIYGERSSARPPPFFSFDLRIDKTYTFRKWKLGTYLDIQNATVAQNIEVINFTYDYRDLDPITSNPPLPVFGFKGEW